MSNKMQEEKQSDHRSRDQQVYDLVGKQKEGDSKTAPSRIMTSDLKKTIKSRDHFIFIFSIEPKITSWISFPSSEADLVALHRPGAGRQEDTPEVGQSGTESDIASYQGTFHESYLAQVRC